MLKKNLKENVHCILFSQGSQQKGRDLEERGGGRVASVDREDEERVQQTVIREHLVGRRIDLDVIE